jgi:hypothetical protein
LFLDIPAIVLGVDRMNEIDRVTSAILWISLGGGLIVVGSAIFSALSRSETPSSNAETMDGDTRVRAGQRTVGRLDSQLAGEPSPG